MGERFAVVSEEDINLLVEKAVSENTKKSTSYAANVSRKTVRFSEEIMSADKYPCIFSRQMETIVYLYNSRTANITAFCQIWAIFMFCSDLPYLWYVSYKLIGKTFQHFLFAVFLLF